MRKTMLFLVLAVFLSAMGFRSAFLPGRNANPANEQATRSFQWPNGKRMALSLSFDDGRLSQVDTGLALLRNRGVRLTFVLLGHRLEHPLDGWRPAVPGGHT